MPNLISPTEIESQSLLDDYFYHRLNFIYIAKLNDFNISEANDKQFKYIKLEDSESELLSIVRLEKIEFHNTNFYCINKSKSILEGKGFATLLYEFCFTNLELPILSDKYQTKAGSSDLWNKLIKKNRQYNVYKFNTVTNKYVELDANFDPYLIWGVDEEKILVQSKSPEVIYDDDYDAKDENTEFDDLIEFDYPIYSGGDYIHPYLIKFIKNGKIKDRYNVRLVVK